MAQNTCEDGTAGQIVAWVLIIGTGLSYVPQMVDIFRHKTSRGVSAASMGLNFLSSTLSFLNVTVLRWHRVQCSRHEPIYIVVESVLPITQLMVGPVFIWLVYVFILAYYDVSPEQKAAESLEDIPVGVIRMDGPPSSSSREWQRRLAYVWFLVLNVTFVILLALSLSLVLLVGLDNGVKDFAKGLGVASSVVIAVVWLPQIFSTLRAQSPGSLSIIMLLVQAPGSVTVCIYQGVLSHSGWSTWLPYAITGVEQAVLIVLWFVFYFKEKALRRGRKDEECSSMETVASTVGLLEDEQSW